MAFLPTKTEQATRPPGIGEIPVNRLTGTLQRAAQGAAQVIQTILLARRPSVGPIEFQCALSEEHGFQNETPDIPVQRSRTQNDTIIELPPKVVMTLVLSDLATSLADQVANFQNNVINRVLFGAKSNRDTGWARLRALNRRREPFDIYTPFQPYTEMVFESVNVTIAEDASDLVIRIVAKKFQQVNVRTQKYLSDIVLDAADEADNIGVQGAVDISALNPDEAVRQLEEGLTDSDVIYYGIAGIE